MILILFFAFLCFCCSQQLSQLCVLAQTTSSPDDGNDIATAKATTTTVNPDLPFGDINIVVLTDVHSFVGGKNRHDPTANANYGDVLSFWERLKEYCNAHNQDLWFVNNGDWMHGTGLAMDGNADHLLPILLNMPWDVVTLGNHESYSKAIVRKMKQTMIPKYNFLTSNVKEIATDEPLGDHYTILEGKNHRLLVFGFLYNHCEPSSLLKVKRVSEAIEQEWFAEALQNEKYHAVLVMAHMEYDKRYVDQILQAIRDITGDDKIPVQFITGHSHIRAEKRLDHYAHSFEAGAFLDTVGFVSFPNHTHAKAEKKGNMKHLFQHQFLDGSINNFTATLQIDPPQTFQTPGGTNLSNLIVDTRETLKLTEVVSCPPHDYFRDVSIHGHNSIYDLWKHVAKQQILKRDRWSVMMIHKDAIRHDIRGALGDVELDDVVKIAPFMEPVLYLGKIPSWVIFRANTTLNTYSHKNKVPDYILAGDIEADGDFDFYTQSYSVGDILEAFGRMMNQDEITPVHTGERDTLYWLDYLEKTFPCDENHILHFKPWFKDLHKLNEELGDSHYGQEGSYDDVDDNAVRQDDDDAYDDASGGETTPATTQQQNADEGYQGYLPPSTIEEFKDELPPAASPSTAIKVEQPPSPTSIDGMQKHTKQELEKRKQEKLDKRTAIIEITGFIVACLLVAVSIFGFVKFIRKRNSNIWDDDEDGLVYDKEELKALRLQQDCQSRPRRKFGRNKSKDKRLRPHHPPKELELT